MLMQAGVLIVAIILAVYSAKILVSGAISIAKRFAIPEFIIGAFIIGFGTSLPEFAVNIQAALEGNTELAIANILGSNLFNTCVTLGLLGLSGQLVINSDVRIKDAPYNLIAALMIAVCGNQLFLDHINYHQIMMSHALIFLCFFCIYVYYTLLEVKQGAPHKQPLHKHHHQALKSDNNSSTAKAFFYIITGLIGLVLGGELIVSSAEKIAQLFGLSNRLIGLLIVGPGTSMPELIASLVALRSRSTALILGNIIGSNIFNVFFTLGITATIQPVPLDFSLNQAVLFNVLAAALLAITFWLVPKEKISRITASLLLLIYCVYTVLAIYQ
ncbi:MAG: calcium/sodium antiporter [Colwellia sp.]|uniref:calcium/sodium antiporter n=1 Tax=Colwellia sp. TaxID=56799 RepID=UPI001DF0573B|nr:calcium/sodium antiporter [Colwellia sp.]NQY50843.1 calcium/sodium antiporter [Colwellia sp.]